MTTDVSFCKDVDLSRLKDAQVVNCMFSDAINRVSTSIRNKICVNLFNLCHLCAIKHTDKLSFHRTPLILMLNFSFNFSLAGLFCLYLPRILT